MSDPRKQQSPTQWRGELDRLHAQEIAQRQRAAELHSLGDAARRLAYALGAVADASMWQRLGHHLSRDKYEDDLLHARERLAQCEADFSQCLTSLTSE